MDTKVSVLKGKGLGRVINANAIVIPVDTLLNISVSKVGKEVSELDGSYLLTQLTEIKRKFHADTGRLNYPDLICLPLQPTKFKSDHIFAIVEPSVHKKDHRDTKVRNLYTAYTSILTLAVNKECQKIALPILGVGNKAYDSTMVMCALIAAVSDFALSNTSLREICIAPRGLYEEHLALKWFDSVAKSFGLEVWHIRNSHNMQDYGLEAITFRL